MYACDSKIRKKPTHRLVISFHNHDCLIEKVYNEKMMVWKKYFLWARSYCVIMFIGNIRSYMPCQAGEEGRICSVLFVCMLVLCSKMWYRSQKVSVSNLRVQLRNSISIIDHKRFCTYAFSPSPLNLCLLIHICLFFCFPVFTSLTFSPFFSDLPLSSPSLTIVIIASQKIERSVSCQQCQIVPLITKLT